MVQTILNFLSSYPGPAAMIAGVIAVIIWLLLKIKKAVQTMWPFIRKLVAVVEDLFGSEARPGVEARPGLMARMQASEEADRQITETLEKHGEALAELRPNHGGSMKDVLNALRLKVDTLETTLSAHIASVTAPEQNVSVVVHETPRPTN